MKATTTQYARCLYEIVKDAKEEKIPSLLDAFLRGVRADRKMGQIKMIISRFFEIWNNEHRTIDVNVASRYPLVEETEKRILQYLQKKYNGREVILHKVIDEKCLGGVRVSACGEIIDMTIVKQLSRLQEQLTQ